ncbi:Uncharacterised protein [Afipia felis]|uniref:Uncharacterized protein n=2 Tax=Afipia felis TaxID=1035 RepID=A0A380WBU2_AFIFE|nr:hypothetical protein HMPREF9697_02216 [Afipia felis ATCC 53690]SUU78395.1 Uncharacterised protein [Afipia felis]SUU86460.1 Uncharacterised protein [Afipia felis]
MGMRVRGNYRNRRPPTTGETTGNMACFLLIGDGRRREPTADLAQQFVAG